MNMMPKDPIQGVLNRFHKQSSVQQLEKCLKQMHEILNNKGINFEGRELPISLQPTIVLQSEIEQVSQAGNIIRSALLRVIRKFVAEHKAGLLNAPLHKFFKTYEKWWDIIACEKSLLPEIQLMRYDAIRTLEGQWQFFETNTMCPGGVIHCAIIRNAWLATQLGHDVTAEFPIIEYAVDSQSSFVKYLVKLAQQVSQNPKSNIAICTYQGFYKNELASLQCEHTRLVNNGEIESGELILADIREIKTEQETVYIKNKEVSLIYNKFDQLMIEPSSPEVVEWIKASQSAKCQFLNSVGAIYLTEAKRVLALLHNPEMQMYLELDNQTVDAINGFIPESFLLDSNELDKSLIPYFESNRHLFVLKPDASTRGAGVYIGNLMSQEEWHQAFLETRKSAGIIQKYVNIPTRYNYFRVDSSNLIPQLEFYGVDFFYFDNQFSGVVSRSHFSQIFNVGNGGKESPTIVLM